MDHQLLESLLNHMNFIKIIKNEFNGFNLLINKDFPNSLGSSV